MNSSSSFSPELMTTLMTTRLMTILITIVHHFCTVHILLLLSTRAKYTSFSTAPQHKSPCAQALVEDTQNTSKMGSGVPAPPFNHRTSSHSIPRSHHDQTCSVSSAGVVGKRRKRVWKACERCRMKKTKVRWARTAISCSLFAHLYDALVRWRGPLQEV